MAEPRIGVRYIDKSDDRGYMSTDVNGWNMSDISIDFETGNNVHFHRQLTLLVEKVYNRGFHDGQDVGKQKVAELVKWAESR